MNQEELSPELARIRTEFEGLVKDFRPELHRYCARIVGSVVDAEDVVQEALATAFYSLGASTVTNLRGWLVRIAHNKAIDWLRRSGRLRTEELGEVASPAEPDRPFDAEEAVALAVSSYLKLTPLQRSCVVLKDVMDYSLAEIGEVIGATVPEVKAALHRGRFRLRALASEPPVEMATTVVQRQEQELLTRYVERFNARDFDGVRAMLAQEVRLDLVGRLQRRGADEVGVYFHRYSQVQNWRFEVGRVENRDAILAFDRTDPSPLPGFFILLEWQGDRITVIRDYLFARYVIRDPSIST